MISYHVPSQVRGCILQSSIILTVKGQVNIDIGIQPFDVDLARERLRTGSFMQGRKVIHGEKGVTHRKISGEVTLLSRDVARKTYYTAASLPTLQLLRGRSWHSVGNHFIPHYGESIVIYEQPSGKRTAFVGVGNGYVFSYGMVSSDHRGAVATMRTARVNREWTHIAKESWGRSEEGVSLNKMISSVIAHAKSASATPLPSTDGAMRLGWIVTNNHVGEAQARTALQQFSGGVKYPREFDHRSERCSLIQKSVESMNALNFNGIAFVQEAIHIKSLLPPFKAFRQLHKPKSWANIYLWFRYGLSLSYADTKTLITSIPKLFASAKKFRGKKLRLRSRSTKTIREHDRVWTVTMSVRILCDSYPDSLKRVGHFVDQMYSLDLAPNFGNFWDLIPFSFVLDWFIPIQDFLDRVDYHGRIQSFTMYAYTESIKYKSDRKLNDTKDTLVIGHCSDSYYVRKVSSSVPSIGLVDGISRPDSPSLRRFIDGAALIIQRAR